MRDIETLLKEAQEIIEQDQAKQKEWLDSLTDEEKAILCERFSAFMETLAEWIKGFRDALELVLNRITEICETFEHDDR